MKKIFLFLFLAIGFNSFSQTQGNIPLHNLRHAFGTDYVIRSGITGKAEWFKVSNGDGTSVLHIKD